MENFDPGVETRTPLQLSSMVLAHIRMDCHNTASRLHTELFRMRQCLERVTKERDRLEEELMKRTRPITIMVRQLLGHNIECQIYPWNTVLDLQETVAEIQRERMEIPEEKPVKLIFAGHLLEPEFTVEHYHIKDGSILHQVVGIARGI